MSLYESTEWENAEEVELDVEEQSGLAVIPGQLVFEDAYTPGSSDPEYPSRYSVTFRTPKESSDHFTRLLAVVNHIGQKTWKKEADEKLEAIWDCIDKGVSPENSNINIQDGDLHNPEYNRGSWQIKASRRLDEGPPSLFDDNNEPVLFDPDDKESVAKARVKGPGKGNLCWFVIRVWCQKKRSRINFTIESIHVVERTKLAVGPRADAKKLTSLVSGRAFPKMSERLALASGADDDDEPVAPAKKGGRKPVATKAVAKASPKKKGVFRR